MEIVLNNKTMENKIGFTNTLFEHSGLSLFANDCEKFGMTWGCRDDCPVFLNGNCGIQEENEELFNQQNNGK